MCVCVCVNCNQIYLQVVTKTTQTHQMVCYTQGTPLRSTSLMDFWMKCSIFPHVTDSKI